MKTKAIPVPANWRQLKHHPLSALVEFGAGIDLDAVIAHMRRNGYDETEPIIIYQGMIFDGRHRQYCAIKADVTPNFRELIGDPTEFVEKKILRQHLNDSQRAMLAAQLVKLQRNRKAQDCAHTQTTAAETFNVSRRLVQDATKVTDHGIKELRDAVKAGTVSVTDAAKVAAEPEKVQKAALKAVVAGQAQTAAEAVTLLCDRCKRVGAVKDCGSCADLRAVANYRKQQGLKREPGDDAEDERRARKQRGKNGSATFDWGPFNATYGALLRQVDVFGNRYKVKESPQAEGLRRQLAEFHKAFKSWYHDTTKSQPPE